MKNIIFAADDNYAEPCIVAIISLLYNNNPNDCAIYILTQGFNERNKMMFEHLNKRFPDTSINVILVDKGKLMHAITTDRFPLANFFRLIIPDIFDFEKALYLDCDIIVNGNIDTLWNINLGENACGMVEDQACEDITLHNRIMTYSPYYNAGVLLINVKKWRDDNIGNRITQFMKDHPERCLYPDQDAINACLTDDIVSLPYKYNVQERWYEPQQCWLMHRNKWEAIEEAKKSPIILHFTAPRKPWMDDCSHPLSALYTKYKQFLISKNSNISDKEVKKKDKEYIERKRAHKHIRRANLFTILFAIETIMFIIYILISR